MTRDQALIIAKRLMRRIEDDQAIHLDSLADELVMGMAVQKPAIVQIGVLRAGEMVSADHLDQWSAAVQNAVQRGYLMGAK